MPIAMRCPGCETRFEFADDLAGKRIKCKTCGDIFRIEKPAPKTARAPAPADDDRPPVSGRSRRPTDDEDNDRPSARNRRPRDDDEDDDRPSGRRRRPADESDDELPRRRREEDDDEDDRPRKKSPILFIALGGLAVLLIAGVVVGVLVFRKGKKGGPGGNSDTVKAPAASCPLEVAEKDVWMPVLPDGGNNFGLLRKTDVARRTWVFEPYDMARGQRTGRMEISDLNEPRAAAQSPDGKYLLIQEGGGFDNTLMIYTVATGQPMADRKWNPYPRGPGLYRAEFVGNDKVVTVSAGRVFDLWQLPTFEKVAGGALGGTGNQFGQFENQEANGRFQRQVAFSADHKLMAVWNGKGYTFVNVLEGQEVFRTPDAKARELFALRQGEPTEVKGGPVAFSPDGAYLAGIVFDWTGRKPALCLWDARQPAEPSHWQVASNQLNEAPGLYWWGNRFVVTHGGTVDGMLIDIQTGQPRRQLMGPPFYGYGAGVGRNPPMHHGFGRDGRLWYFASKERNQPAVMHVVDGLDPDLLGEVDDYDQNLQLGEEFFLRRLWLEPTGVMRKPTRDDPPLGQRLIRRPKID